MSQQSFPGLCLPLLLTTIPERSMANCPRPIQVFVSPSHLPGNRLKGWPGPHTAPHCSQRGFMEDNSWCQYESRVVACANLPIRELSLIQGLYICLKYSLSFGLFTSLTKSGGRTDACQAVEQTWQTSYINILTIVWRLSCLFSRVYTCGWHFARSSVVIQYTINTSV